MRTRRIAVPKQADPKAAFLRALEGGRNEQFKAIFGRFLERSDNLRLQENGRWYFWCNLSEADKGAAYVFADQFDRYEYTSAMITHDLHSFECRDVVAVIDKLRCN